MTTMEGSQRRLALSALDHQAEAGSLITLEGTSVSRCACRNLADQVSDGCPRRGTGGLRSRLTLLHVLILIAALLLGLPPSASAEGNAERQLTVDPSQALPILSIGMLGSAALIPFDEAIFSKIHEDFSSPEIERGMSVVTQLGGPIGIGAVAAGLALTGEKETATKLAKAVLISTAITAVTKYSFGAARPYVGEGRAFHGFTLNGDYSSFPSGHTAAAFAMAEVLADRYPKERAVFYLLATAVAISRICEKAHWPGDLMLSAAIGVLSGREATGRINFIEVRF